MIPSFDDDETGARAERGHDGGELVGRAERVARTLHEEHGRAHPGKVSCTTPLRLAGRMQRIAQEREAGDCARVLRRAHLGCDASAHRFAADEKARPRDVLAGANGFDHGAPRGFELVVLVGHALASMRVQKIERDDVEPAPREPLGRTDHPGVALSAAGAVGKHDRPARIAGAVKEGARLRGAHVDVERDGLHGGHGRVDYYAMSHADSRKVVMAALVGNIAIAALKFAAAILSHSTATLAEAVHSLADTGNQGLLLVGMTLAARPADERFPFGRAGERYFWPFVVALLLFSVGGAFAIFEGMDYLAHPRLEVHARFWSYAVLSLSLALEAASFRVALDEFRKMAAGGSLRRALFEARDPTVSLVLAEDATAMVGLLVALVAVAASALTGHDIWDPIGSIVIGTLLCVIALVLANITHGLIIGESATAEDRARVLDLAAAVDGVERVTQLLTLHLGPDVILLAMKIAFRPTLSVDEVERVTDRLESKIRTAMPQMRKIFVEADSRGDQRGVDAPRNVAASPHEHP